MFQNPQMFIDQQMGFRTWNTYNCALERLHCTEDHSISIFDENAETTPIFACKFAEKPGYEEYLALAHEDGQLIICNTEKKEMCNNQRVHNNAIFDVAWLSDALKVLTVSGDHTARLVNIETEMQVEQIFTGHNRSVKTVATRQTDSSVFATGSRDGSIRIWDTRCAMAANLIVNADRTIENSHCKISTGTPNSSKRCSTPTMVTAANSVTGLVFQNADTLISCSSGDGLIKVWDLRKSYTNNKNSVSKFSIPYCGNTTRNGFSNLLIDPSGVKLYASCLDNTIYAYNVATYSTTPVMEYKGHQNGTFYVKSALSSDGVYLLSGSSDQHAYIWNLKDKKPLVKLQGHTAEVTCVAWRRKGDITLVTCSDDVKHKIWRVRDEDYSDYLHYGNAERIGLINVSPVNKRKYSNENTPVQYKMARIQNRKRSGSSDSEYYFPESKRFNSGRKLFDITNNIKEHHDLSAIVEESENVLKTPTSDANKPQDDYSSPTTNLPNFVLDGIAPHLHYSPQKRPDKDWLTKMRYERHLYREMSDASEGPSAKVPRLSESSPGSRVSTTGKTPTSSRKRRNKQTERCGSPDLRKFFRITNNSILKDTQCSPKSLIINSPQHLQH